MRPFGLALRIALFFTLLAAAVLLAVLHLFGVAAGEELRSQWTRFQAYEGVAIAEQLELRLAESSAELTTLLAEAAQQHGVELSLEDADGLLQAGSPASPRRRSRHRPVTRVEIGGRACKVLGPPFPEAEIPLRLGGGERGTLRVRSRLHSPESHAVFRDGLLRIGILAVVAVIGLAFYLAAPLHRVSRSMDRIAAGDLGHRVRIRGPGEVARMGRSFNAMADRIEQLLRGQKELMAGVSHELRSPLARMRLSLELLRETAAPGQRLDDLAADIEAIDGLVGEILAATRLELGSLPSERQEISLQELSEQAWRRLEATAGGSEMQLEVDGEIAAARVAVDAELGRRILGNLFQNACRYAGPGTVRVTGRRRGKRIEIAVSDRGPGVPEEHLPHLFEPFYRVDPSRSRKTGASGLGLMIVRRAVEAHGGRIAARLPSEGGLEVVFDLPAGD